MDELRLYVGTYTKPESGVAGAGAGVYVLGFQPSTLGLRQLGLISAGVNPTYLAFDRAGETLYAANEHWHDHGPEGRVSAFRLGPDPAAVIDLGGQTSRGLAPCYVSLDRAGQHLLVANYGTGHLVVFPVLAGGEVGPACTVTRGEGSGPHPGQAGPHAHCIEADLTNRHVLATDLGADRVWLFSYEAGAGRLHRAGPGFVAQPGDGPRHLAFHPNGRTVYVVNELSSTVTVLAFDPEQATLTGVQRLSTLPPGYTSWNAGADVHVSPGATHVYVSNRGHDSLATFAIHPASGQLEPLDWVGTGGKTPRSFSLDPTGQYVFVCNQGSDNLCVLAIQPGTGLPGHPASTFSLPTPACVKVWTPHQI